MPIVFEEVTGEVAPERSAGGGETQASTPGAEEDLRERMLVELALLRERRARLFTD
jgi:hypothetical protein